jgi:hypothetical protein
VSDTTEILIVDGSRVDLLSPDLSKVSITTIAYSLSNLCRFTGHTSEFYSVAQHCVVVSRLVPERLALWGLLHDAAEAFVNDLSSPLKRLAHDYQVIEAGLELAVLERFGVQWTPEDAAIVKHEDVRALSMEKRDLMPPDDEYWGELPDPLPYPIHPLPPVEARTVFLARFSEITLGLEPAPAPEAPRRPDPHRFEDTQQTSERLAREEEEIDAVENGDWTVVG